MLPMSTRDDEKGPPHVLFDRRIIDRSIKKGFFTRKDYEKFLKALPDSADKAAPIGDLDQPEDDDMSN